MRTPLRAAIALLATAQAPVASPTPPAPSAAPAVVNVEVDTAAGPIEIALEKDRAPLGTVNFMRYIDQKKLAGTSVYRVVKVQPGYGLVQFGTQNDPRKTLPPIAHEPTTQTGLSHTDGAIALARAEPGTAAGDFFIVVGGFPSMDADPKAPGDNQGYAVFGHVVKGMEVVRALLEKPTAPGGPPGMQNQMLATPVAITGAKRLP